MNETTEITTEERNITPEQWLACFEAMTKEGEDRPITNEDIIKIAEELEASEDFGRSKNSAWFAINRLHVIYFSEAAYGITERRAETMFQDCRTANRFAAEYLGIEDIDERVNTARQRLQAAIQLREDAPQINLEYWKANKNRYSSAQQRRLVDSKVELIELIARGVPVEEAYAQIL